MKVTVIIPTLNEAESIGQTIDQIPKDFANIEILIIDGASKDKTVEISENKSARVIIEKRKGYGRAYKTGFAEARGDIICTLDGDTTYPAEEFPKLVKMLIDEDLDFISCDRLTLMDKGAMTTTHKFGNWALKVGTNVLFRTKLKDSQTGMWVFRKKKVLENIKLVSDGMPLSEEIKIECFTNENIKAKEVSVPYRPRIGEIKLNTWGDGKKNMMYLFKKKVGKVSPDFPEEGEKEEKTDENQKGSQGTEVSEDTSSDEETKEKDAVEIEIKTTDDLKGSSDSSNLQVELEGEKTVETEENASVTIPVGEAAGEEEEKKPDEEKKEEEASKEESSEEKKE